MPSPGTSAHALARRPPSGVIAPWLVRFRWVSFAALVTAGWAAVAVWHVHLPMPPLLGLLLAMALTNVALWWQLRSPAPRRAAIGGALAVDVALLTGVLFLAGGPLNPFSILYLVTITIAAVALGHRWALGTALFANMGYGLVSVYNRPLVFHDPTTSEHVLPLHLWGMWVAFVSATALLAHFVGRVSGALEQREHELADVRASAARSDRLAALLSLGAGAAHELATPLSTIGTATGELARLVAADNSLAQRALAAGYVDVIRAELVRCEGVLDQLSARAISGTRASVAVDLERLVLDVRQRLGGTLSSRLDVTLPVAPRPLHAPTEELRQTLVALVRNAFEASPPDERVLLAVSQGEGLRLEIRDSGRGMSEDESARVGEPFYTTKAAGGGLGLGLFLARAFVEQMGGRLTWESALGVGTCVVVELPGR